MASNNSDQAFSIIFMDINMPIMDGLEATRILNKKIASKEI
jgi:CheY-like chemotaxis protein